MTSNNQRLGTVFNYPDPRLSLICQVGDDVIRRLQNLWGMPDVRFPRSIHWLINCPIQSRLQPVLGVHSFYIECNNNYYNNNNNY